MRRYDVHMLASAEMRTFPTTQIYAPNSIIIHGLAGFISYYRAAFSTVLIGNQNAESARLDCHASCLGGGMQIVSSGAAETIFGVTGCRGATASGFMLTRSSGGQIVCGCLCGQFGAGGEAELGEDVRQVRLDGAGGDEQAPGDGLVPQAVADQADDLQFGGGQAGPAGGGSFAAAALRAA